MTDPASTPGGSRWHSLRLKIALPFMLLSLIVLSGLYFLLGDAVERTQMNTMEAGLRNQAQITALAVPAMTDPESTLHELASETRSRMTLIDASGEVIVDTQAASAEDENHNDRPEVIVARVNGFGSDQRLSETTGTSMLYVAVMVPDSNGEVLRMAVPTTSVSSAVADTERVIALATLVSMLTTFAAAWYFAGRITRPLKDLVRQSMRIAGGDYSGRLMGYGISEIDSLNNAFNRMSGQLDEMTQRQERTSSYLELVMNELIDGVVLTDDQGLVLRMNPTAQTMFGIEESDAVGKPFVQAARDYEIAKVVRKAFEGKSEPTATVEHGVDHQVIQVVAQVVEGEHQRLCLVLLRDVTEVRRLETVRREFVANVSHELRTPLTSIRAMAETLEAGAMEDSILAADFLSRITREIDRLNTMVDEILDFARLESGRTPLDLEYVNLADVIQQALNDLMPQLEGAGLTLETEITNDLPEIAVDSNRIQQVIINLVHNAIKFTPSGGTLILRSWRERNTLYVSLKDTGIGIPENEQARLFERFYKSDKSRVSGGSGLGLAIAQQIVRLHGGQIWVESDPGRGSTFTFMLPMKRKKAAKRARKHTLSGLI